MRTTLTYDTDGDHFTELAAWAEAGDFSDVHVGEALTGDAARAYARAVLEAAGVDVEALDAAREADLRSGDRSAG